MLVFDQKRETRNQKLFYCQYANPIPHPVAAGER